MTANGIDHRFKLSIFFCCSYLVIITLLSSLILRSIDFLSPSLLYELKSLIIFLSVSGKSAKGEIDSFVAINSEIFCFILLIWALSISCPTSLLTSFARISLNHLFNPCLLFKSSGLKFVIPEYTFSKSFEFSIVFSEIPLIKVSINLFLRSSLFAFNFFNNKDQANI